MRIAVDAMGGDHAPRAAIEGALSAARSLRLSLILFGPEGRLSAELERYPFASSVDLEIRHAAEVVEMGEAPVVAIRRKPRASIRLAAEAVARGEADAVFTAGNTGAAVIAAHAAFGMLPGVDRPALAATIPTRAGSAVLLDSGANVECRPAHLLQFATMGAVFARLSLQLEHPRVGLLSIGEEETKGNDLTRETHRLLKDSSLNFVGNLDARGLYSGEADVIVCDGFTGNIALKVSESVVETVEGLLSDELSTTFTTRLGSLLSRRAFRRFRRRVDYAESGGAPLLGVSRPCVIGHGRSGPKAIRNALALTQRYVAAGLLDRLGAELA
jgi:glycerol-3-phosphate acyltransferase PlsX